MKMKSNNRKEKNQEKEKRGADEARAKQRKDRARNFIFEKETALMEGSLKDRRFIAERGFKKIISHFAEMLENRG